MEYFIGTVCSDVEHFTYTVTEYFTGTVCSDIEHFTYAVMEYFIGTVCSDVEHFTYTVAEYFTGTVCSNAEHFDGVVLVVVEVFLFLMLRTCVELHLYNRLSVFLSHWASNYVYAKLSLCLSACLFISLSACVSIYLPACLYLSIDLSLYLLTVCSSVCSFILQRRISATLRVCVVLNTRDLFVCLFCFCKSLTETIFYA